MIDTNNKDEDNKVEKSNKNSMKNFINEWAVPIISAIILAFLINKFLLFKVLIPSESMVPTLNVGDRLFVTRVYNLDKLKRGDIIVFYSEELQDSLIKRLIGLPGDKVKIENGIVSVNGEELQEEYIGATDKFNGEYEVPEGKYFFLGDNRLWSKDSRYWINPYISKEDIKGKAQIKVYPFNELGKIK
ncbi:MULTISPECIES: signal peptidase I [Clostridium]|uniref:Signal peptidase I n=1 Tax=Clostridium sartagoforme AAU1 TaxID=1202534 RepID=R9BW01_9CLOT|nr:MULTISPECIES: signal peptidase I [Clostridium]EOR21227.1 signal peptidase I [Clostridium sartagoforme AAU1]KLE16797.1 signal peptidase I [Clostridium sp. C8]